MRFILRAAIGLIAIILVSDALVLIARGVMFTWHAYHNLADPTVERPMLHALEAVDLFFLALVFFIMAIGLVQLFIGDIPLVRQVAFSWLRIESFSALKLLLWDTFLVTMLVLFFTRLISEPEMDWNLLIMPAGILMLTISSFLLKQRH